MNSGAKGPFSAGNVKGAEGFPRDLNTAPITLVSCILFDIPIREPT